MYTAVARYFCLSVATYCFFSTLSPPYNPPDAAGSVKCVVFQKPAALAQRFGMLRRLPSFSGYSMSSK